MIIDWLLTIFGFEKSTSIFRKVDRPVVFLKTELRNGENWLITYIRCDECSTKAEECSFDYQDRKWKCGQCHFKIELARNSSYNKQIPDYYPSPEEISKMMRSNVDILKQEITDHIDKELKRFNEELEASNGKCQ